MSNKFGVHGLVFTDSWHETRARSAVDAAARLGFDFIEILIFDPEAMDAGRLDRLARDAGIGITVGMALSPDADISSLDPLTAERGERVVARSLEVARDLGADAMSGLIYAALDRYRVPPTAVQRAQVVAALARLDRRAGELGLRLGLEPVNRYESHMVNTLDQAGAIIREIGSTNLFIHADTFHMNLEESDVAGAIARNGDLMGYVHLADNHRGTLGGGTFDFTSLFRALKRAEYQGIYTFESFSSAVLGPEIAGAVALWRQQWQDAEATARQALAFMRAQLAAAEAAARIPA